MQSVTYRGGRPLMAALLLSTALATACSSGDVDATVEVADAQTRAAELVALLPETVEAAAIFDTQALFGSETVPAMADLADGAGTDPALSAAFVALRSLSLELDLGQSMATGMLVQGPDPQGGLALLARMNWSRIQDLVDTAGLFPDDGCGAVDGFFDEDRGLRVCLFGDGLLLIGPPGALDAILRVRSGEQPAAADSSSPLRPYLTSLLADASMSFVVGLPGLTAGTPETEMLSLQSAHALTGRFELSADTYSGQVSIHTPNARAVVDTFNMLSLDEPISVLEPPAADQPGSIAVAIDDAPIWPTPPELLEARRLLKKLVFGMEALDYASGVRQGGNPPWLAFEVGGPPYSIFINFEFKDEQQIAAFERDVLPDGFALAPLRILDDDEPTYFLVLNAYLAGGGLVSGVRAEWSVFVEDPQTQQPRFLVIEALASDASADPVNLLTPPEIVSHELGEGELRTSASKELEDGSAPQNYFTSTIVWPASEQTLVAFAREFVAANDYIFWGNAVADRGLYNGTVHNREALLVPDRDLELQDDTPWASYIRPRPVHTVVYQQPLEIVASPWWNLDESYLDVSTELRSQLTEFKNAFYPGLMRERAEQMLRSEGDTLAGFCVGSETATAFYNFVITDPPGFAESLVLPPGHALAPVQVLESDAEPGFYLTLRVADQFEQWAGKSAQWLTYIDDGSGRPKTFVVGSTADRVAVDPDRVVALSGVVSHERDGSELRSRAVSHSWQFEGAVDLSTGTQDQPTLDWIAAGDDVCWGSGVCDKQFYDGATLQVPVIRVENADVSVKSPWQAYIGSEPGNVFVREAPQQYASYRWHNVR